MWTLALLCFFLFVVGGNLNIGATNQSQEELGGELNSGHTSQSPEELGGELNPGPTSQSEEYLGLGGELSQGPTTQGPEFVEEDLNPGPISPSLDNWGGNVNLEATNQSIDHFGGSNSKAISLSPWELAGELKQAPTSPSLEDIDGLVKASKWKTFSILCDTNTELIANEDNIIKKWPMAKFIQVDFKKMSLLVSTFENSSKLSQMNWLVFCSECVPLLNVINQYENTHRHQGYFTHLYQWVVITRFAPGAKEFSPYVGAITHLTVVNTHALDFYTAMFGKPEGARYFDRVGNITEAREMDKKQIFPNLRHGLNAAHLRMTSLPWSPFVTKLDNGTYTGYYIELLAMIARELNFTFDISGPPDGQYGLLDPKTGLWTGMVRQLIDDEADIAAVLTYSAQRDAVVDQPSQAVDVDYGLIIYHTEPPMLMSIGLIIRPFSQNVWLCFLGIMLIASVAFACSQRFGRCSTKRHYTGFGNYTYIFRSTLNQGSPLEPYNPSSRIIYSIYALGWIILMASYTAHLVALLSVQIEKHPFETMLQVAENTDYKLGMLGGTLTYSQFMLRNFSAGNTLGKLQAKMIRDAEADPEVLSTNYSKHLHMLDYERYATYTTRSDYESIATGSCSVAPLKERGYVLFNGYMLQKNSVYTHYLSEFLRHIQEGNLDNKIRQQFWPKPLVCTTGYDPTVRIGNLLGIFYILLGGVLLAFFVLLVEMIADKIKHMRRTVHIHSDTEPPPESTERYQTYQTTMM